MHECLLVVANWSSGPVTLPEELPDLAGAEVLLDTHGSASAQLVGWESRVYRLG